MAIIGNISIALDLDSAKFQTGIKGSQASVNKFVKQARRKFKQLDRSIIGLIKPTNLLKGAVVGLAGAGGLGLLIKQSLATIDVVGKMSKTYGIATEEIGAFKLAAAIGGSSLQMFAKAARQVANNVFDFVVRGTGEAKDAFEELGITVDKLEPIMNDSAAVMALIGDEINKLTDGQIKTALAAKLLGARSVELLPALAGGAAQMKKYRIEAKQLGIAMSGSAVKGVEDANDSITRLGFVFQGLQDQTTAALAPAIKLAVDGFKEFVTSSINAQGGVQNFGKSLAIDLVSGAITAIGWLGKIVAAFEFLIKTVNGIRLVFKLITALIVGFVAGALQALDMLNKGAAAVINILPGINIKPSGALTAWATASSGAFLVLIDDIRELAQSMADTDSSASFSNAINQAEKFKLKLVEVIEKQRETQQSATSIKIDDSAKWVPGGLPDAEFDLITSTRASWIADNQAAELQRLQDHQDAMTSVSKDAIDTRTRYERLTDQQKSFSALSNTARLASALQSRGAANNKKSFEQNKVLQKSMVLLNLPSAIMRGYADGGAYGAFVAAAVGAVQLSRINSAQFGGGGSSSRTASSVGGTGGSVSPQSGLNLGQQTTNNNSNRVVNVNVYGFVPDSAFPRLVAEGIRLADSSDEISFRIQGGQRVEVR